MVREDAPTFTGTASFSAISASSTITGSNLSGTNTGDQTSVTGNAGTATALQTARTINGTSFDGTANITVAAASGTLTGTTLNSSVVTSSLTSVGTLTGGATGAGFTINVGASTVSGTVPPSNLGSGSSISTKFLRGDSTWQTIAGGGDALTSSSLAQFAATTSAELRGVLSDELGTGAALFDGATPTSFILTNATGLPTAGMLDSAVTLAKMANLAQDQFIGRTTASTGVPETATITAAARTVLDDTTVAAMVDTLGGTAATGTGALVRKTSPALVTPDLGVATATSVNKVTITAPTTGATLTLADGSSLLTAGAFTVTFTATAATAVTLPTTGTLATLAGSESLTNKKLGSLTSNGLVTTSSGDGTLSVTVPGTGVLTFLATPSSANLLGAITDETGTGALVFATSPTLVTPALGTPASGNLASCTGYPTTTIVAEQATTSGTSIDFTGIPAGVTTIKVMLVGVSTNGTSEPLIQIGDSGGIETSGYVSFAGAMTTSAVSGSGSTAGFNIKMGSASGVLHGCLILSRENATHTWTITGTLARSDVTAGNTCSGTKTLSAELDRLRFTTTNGTDTFDAGSIGCSYVK